MFGWRKRIGYIGPTVMEVVPYEFYRFAPDGVGLVGVTCSIEDWSSNPFDKGLAQVTSAATYECARAVDFIIQRGGQRRGLRGAHRQGDGDGRQGSGHRRRACRHGGVSPFGGAGDRDRLTLFGP